MALLRRAGPAAALLLAAGAAIAAGCFSPQQPGCAFSCANPPHACPASYECGDDGFCHRSDGLGYCNLGASTDAAAGDAPDGPTTE